MKKLFILPFLLVSITSCKKEYTCSCYTIHERRGTVNNANYTIKEKKKEDAHAKCINQYEASGLATWGANCDVI